MSKIALPALTRPAGLDALAFEVPGQALARWNPALAAAEDSADTSISMYGFIGEDFMGDGVSARRIAAALRKIGSKDVTVNLNSPGGDFFEGLAIYNLLREHPHNVTVKVLGMAGSAASIIAMAGDDIQMSQASFLMIHNVWVVAGGNRHVMAHAAETLAAFDDALAGLYAARSGQDKADIAAMMDKETWLGVDQAVEQGFADGLIPADQVKEDQNNAAAKQAHHWARIDAALRKDGMPRSERRAFLKQARGDSSPTAQHESSDVSGEVQQFAARMRALSLRFS